MKFRVSGKEAALKSMAQAEILEQENVKVCNVNEGNGSHVGTVVRLIDKDILIAHAESDEQSF